MMAAGWPDDDNGGSRRRYAHGSSSDIACGSMACPLRVLLVAFAAIWAVAVLKPAKVAIVFQPIRMKWYFAVVIMALHVDILMQLGFTQSVYFTIARQNP